MSIDAYYYTHQKRFTTQPPVIKSPSELIAQRQSFRESQSHNSDFELINKIYEIVRSIRDPEHPYTLEQLDMINENDIHVETKRRHKHVKVFWKPSAPTCVYATQIGLAIRLKLEKELNDSEKLKLLLLIKSGGHRSKNMIDKQINDKERIIAAKENDELMAFIESLIS